MLKRALICLCLIPAVAYADGETPTATTTTTAGTVVVVTPSVVVTSGAAAPAAPAAVTAPGMPAAAPAVAPNGAPINEPWSNVSHINGTPVPVGGRNAYLYEFKKTNLSVDPFGPFWGYYDVAVAHAVSNNVALSAGVTGWNHNGDTGYQVTVSAPIYFRRTFSGPFIEPGLIVRSSNNGYDADAACDGCGGSTANVWAGPELLFGWQWNFDSGLNVSWALGVAKHAVENGNEMNSGDSDPDFNGYFRVGYNF
jgi:hypothetical protein